MDGSEHVNTNSEAKNLQLGSCQHVNAPIDVVKLSDGDANM